MSAFSLILIGLSLSMDAAALAISNGLVYHGGLRQHLATALVFGLAQALMPILGYLTGGSLAGLIGTVGHWLAFLLLTAIGGKMICSGVQELRRPDPPPASRRLPGSVLLLQALATSVDALIVGVGFAALQTGICRAALIIGGVTVICCLLGTALGQRLGRYVRRYAVICGGVMLIGSGLKILLEHLAG